MKPRDISTKRDGVSRRKFLGTSLAGSAALLAGGLNSLVPRSLSAAAPSFIEATIPDLHADIVLYCGGGYRSALAADNLQRMGYTNVTSMDGGWRAWTESGFPTAKD